MPETLVLHHISLTQNTEIAPGLFLARDMDGLLRAHNGKHHLGYIKSEPGRRNRKGERRYGISAWVPDSTRVERSGWKTLAGAERAFRRILLCLYVGEQGITV
jgi:hypothetical protein